MHNEIHDMRQEKIRAALLYRSGDGADASAVADATLGVWQEMSSQLAPVIGARGVDVLLARALHLTSTDFPWIANARDHGDGTNVPASLKARLASLETDAAAEASHALLVKFTELLTSLIGESLTDRLLAPVWPPPGNGIGA